MKNKGSLEAFLIKDIPGYEESHEKDNQKKEILDDAYQELRKRLLELLIEGFEIPFYNKDGDEVKIVFKMVQPEFNERGTNHIFFSDGDTFAGRITIATHDDNIAHLLNKEVKEPYQGMGVATLATSIFFEILIYHGFEKVIGAIAADNEFSSKARWNTEVLFGPNRGGYYAVVETPKEEKNAAFPVTQLLDQIL